MKLFRVLFLLIIMLITVSCSEEKDFNSDEWKNWTESEISPNLRWQMHKDLLENYELKTYNRKQIMDLLGKPNLESNDEYFYQLGSTGQGINTGTMKIIFENDYVVDVEITNG